MSLRREYRLFMTAAAALGLSSCAVKDGRLDFTWWQDAAAPVMEDDVIIESGSGGYYHSSPAPAKVPAASIPTEQPEIQPAPQQEEKKPLLSQNQPADTAAPARAPRTTRKPAPAVTATPGIYIVQPGDTLTAIARRHGTTVKALVTANGMASADVPLRVNQQLRIAAGGSAAAPAPAPAAPISPRPAAPAPTSQGGTYTVQAGDTLYRIARQHGVNPAALMQANGLTPETANKIRVGTTLRIPKAP